MLLAAATSAALLEKNRLSVVREQIDEVVSSSETGARLLGVAQRQVHMEKVGELVETHVDMIGENDITEATLIEARAKFLECLKGEGCDAMARFAPKEVAVQHRGQPIVVSVTSALEHYTFAAEALVRSAAVDGGLLDPLWGESELVGIRPKPRIQVDKACVKMAQISRIAVRDELGDEEASSENIQRVLKGKASFLNSCDRYFRVEQAFWMSFCGSSIDRKVHALILASLPCCTKPLTLAESSALMAKAEENKLLAFAGPSSRAVFKLVQSYLTTLTAGKSPALEKLGDGTFPIAVKLALARFCIYGGGGPGSANDGARLTGSKAAKALVDNVFAKQANPKATVQFADLVPCLTFAWLLEPADKAKLTKLKNEVVAKSGFSEAHSSSASAD